MSATGIVRLLSPSAALLAVAAITACSSATTTAAGEPAPPAAATVLASGDVLTRAQIEQINPSRTVDLLDGHFAGVRVVTFGGEPRIVIRGLADPLVVVDDVPLADPRGIWSLDPHDIEQIQILKGDEAVLYGSRGGHGVVLITTRRR